MKREFIHRQDLYVPKSFSPQTYNRFIRQFVDIYNYGWVDENGRKRFRLNTAKINERWASMDRDGLYSMQLQQNRHIIPHLANRTLTRR